MTSNAADPRAARGYDRVGVWLGIAFGSLLVGVGIFIASSGPALGFYSKAGPGPGFIPLFIGSSLALVALIYVLQRLVVIRKSTRPGVAPEPPVESDSAHAAVAAAAGTATLKTIDFEESNPDAGIKRAVAIVASLVALAVLLEPLGYQLSMLFFLFFQLRILGKQGWVISSVLSVAGSFGVFLLFTAVLRVALPTSDIPFLRAIGL